uniref:Uncharacterized protein n=1 Tax=Chromera velia CCMP2878 TaxID=1169474 RepID=A0A0G4H673_9ALVE|eukprot:Cvel_24843.t1-p1 / transcript=Cvel_24843.t1 / gene=Cvel_24843 / organism=Chromera_velia_CCMP2878 / gene_product=hypothetical protein / transcript_product=hypothetical protein / location=Cvel_scaffold2741:10398-10877(-) / protein_length=160 / sequence_SO=supercontig / SO=protein_coding / is_pseudo=false
MNASGREGAGKAEHSAENSRGGDVDVETPRGTSDSDCRSISIERGSQSREDVSRWWRDAKMEWAGEQTTEEEEADPSVLEAVSEAADADASLHQATMSSGPQSKEKDARSEAAHPEKEDELQSEETTENDVMVGSVSMCDTQPSQESLARVVGEGRGDFI